MMMAGLLASVVSASAQQAGALQTAATTLGTGTIKTLQITGSGKNFSVGQNFTPAEGWPPVTVKSYTAAVNLDTAAMRQELVREMGATMPRGGGAPFFGEQRQIQVVSGNFAWNLVPPPPAPANERAQAGRVTLNEALQFTGVRPLPPQPAAQPAAGNQVERMLFFYSLPQAFVKAAQANNATTKKGKNNTTEVTFTLPSKHKLVGTINAQGQVVKVQTWMDQSIVGDMLVETSFSDYKDFGGVFFPAHIVQTQDGYTALDLTISDVKAGQAVDLPVPPAVQNAPAPAAPVVMSEKLGDGAYYLTGGTHHSLAVEMKDHIVVVDLPNNQARAQAVLAKAKELIPNKPVKFVVTSHHHWDHLGGIREAFAEGATIVTHESNKKFLERVAKTPHTLNPDRQATAKGKAKIQTVADKGVLTDGTRTIELHLLKGYEHTGDMLVVYLPKEKVLAEPDAFTPPPQAGTALIPPAVPYAKALYDNIKRLNLDVAVIAPFHGNRKTDVAEVARAAGVTSTN